MMMMMMMMMMLMMMIMMRECVLGDHCDLLSFHLHVME
jgi:hypothetical protein